jgi:hypothetical protein
MLFRWPWRLREAVLGSEWVATTAVSSAYVLKVVFLDVGRSDVWDSVYFWFTFYVILCDTVFRRVRKMTKDDVMFVRPSSWDKSAPTEQIVINFTFEYFSKIV